MAAALLRVVIEYADGTTSHLVVKPATVVAFEREHNVGLGALSTDRRMSYIYWLAWDAEKRTGKVVKPFDGWLDEIVDVDLEDDAAPLGPAAPTPLSSPDSQ